MTALEFGAAFVALVTVLLAGTHGTHLGLCVCLFGAWTHEPILIAIGTLWCYATLPDKGGGGGNARHA